MLRIELVWEVDEGLMVIRMLIREKNNSKERYLVKKVCVLWECYVCFMNFKRFIKELISM